MRSLVLLLLAATSLGCGWTSDHLSSPSHIPDGKTASPPRFVRILEWKRPDWFRGEYLLDGQWNRDEFVLLRPEQAPASQSTNWHVPAWTQHHQPEPIELTKEEREQLKVVQRKFPTDSIVEVEYPLIEKRYQSQIGQGSDVRVPRDQLSIYAGYLVSIKKRVRNAILLPGHER